MGDELIDSLKKLYLGESLSDYELNNLIELFKIADTVIGQLEFHPQGAMWFLHRNWVRQELNRMQGYQSSRKERNYKYEVKLFLDK